MRNLDHLDRKALESHARGLDHSVGILLENQRALRELIGRVISGALTRDQLKDEYEQWEAKKR